MSASELPEALRRYLEDFLDESDFGTRADMLIEFAEEFEEVRSEVASRPFAEDHRAPHCESEAFVWVEARDESMDPPVDLHFAVENPQGISAMALCSILSHAFSGAPASQVRDIPVELIYELFGRNISMGKGQGLTGVIQLTNALAGRLATA